MMPHIASAAKAARIEAKLSHAHIAAVRGVRESTIVRFESGRMRRVDVDEMLVAYAQVTGLAVIEFWERALAGWRDVLSDESTTNRRKNGDGNNARTRNKRRSAAQRA